MEPHRQPHLHHHLTCVRAPATWLSRADGQVRDGADGLYVADRRVLSRYRVTVDGAEPAPLRGAETGADTAVFTSQIRRPAHQTPDPTLWCERQRTTLPNGGTETLTLVNASREPVTLDVVLAASADFASLSEVKAGEHREEAAAEALTDGLAWSASDGLTVTLRASEKAVIDAAGGTLRWQATVPANGEWSVQLTVAATPPRTEGFRPLAPTIPAPWHADPLSVSATDARFTRLLDTSVADLTALLLADPLEPADLYPAAGSPWYLTLFARDSIWASMLALPLGPELVGATLRTLARRQGTKVDPATEEQPGKIPHELRPTDATKWLPPVYYGTIDATPLFVVALVQAWRWGLPSDQVAKLLPAAERALAWMAEYGDADGDGFIEYVPTGVGLVNQGWKDSHDGIQYADGRIAQAPLGLAEVQGYAYQAAIEGATLLDAFGRPGAEQWRTWAAELAERFRKAFWVADDTGRYPAVALQSGNPVDGVASNMGHLLGTGLLTAEEAGLIADRLVAPSLASGFGLRTLADTSGGFNPLSYHAGSVWPHDTAIAVLGLAHSGHGRAAGTLLSGLVAAAPAFGYRLPELFGGQRASETAPPTPYPAACRPQAWAAAAGPAAVQALLGLRPDVPNGRVTLSPISPSPIGAFTARNIRLGTAGTLDVSVAADGTVTEYHASSGLTVDVIAAH